jgi:hypothetical protein
MPAMLFGGRQRQNRDPSRRGVPGKIRPVDVNPIAGRDGCSHRTKGFLKAWLKAFLKAFLG